MLPTQNTYEAHYTHHWTGKPGQLSKFVKSCHQSLIKIEREGNGVSGRFSLLPGPLQPHQGNCRQARHQQTSSPPFIGEIINYSAKVHLNWKGFKRDYFVVETTLAESGQCLSSRLNVKTGFIQPSFGAMHRSQYRCSTLYLVVPATHTNTIVSL